MLHHGDCLDWLKTIPPGSVQCCVTSPPYFGLRDYGVDGQIGLEPTPDEYVAKMVTVFAEVRRVLADDGTLWLNLGDAYAGGGGGGNPTESLFRKQATNRGSLVNSSQIPPGLKPKDLIGIPWRVAFALQSDWYLRSDIIWHKPNPMTESVTDRPTKAHEYLFLFAKSERYFFNKIEEPATYAGQSRGGSKKRYQQNAAGMDSKVYDTRNARSVWTIKPARRRFTGVKHFATMPDELAERCILAGSNPGDTVLDPFAGSGTTLIVAEQHGRIGIGCELNIEYANLARRRLASVTPELIRSGA